MLTSHLGRYKILEPLGRGGMGEVYLAEDPALGRKVAIKVLPAELQSDPDRRSRLLHEARAASALNHPNIVVIHDTGETDGSLFVAMEVIEGETLGRWTRKEGPDPRRIVGLMRQVGDALAVAHEAGLVHRDLKPENLMVRGDGLVKILDFGLARSVCPELSDRTATLPGVVVGTVHYMSPEQVLGKPAGPSSDLFSLGTILYELLTGRHPFEGDTAIDVMHRILHETPEPLSRVNPGLAASFDFVVGKMLAKDPARRQASARDLIVDLETLESGFAPVSTPALRVGMAPVLKAVAVLPFKNIGGDASLHHLGMGFADAVINRLSASPDMIVRATSAVSRFQDQAVDPRQVGQELQADIVLDASFQRAHQRLRVTARLVEASTGRSLWADRIDVSFDDIFDVQDQVARGIAEALTARLTTRPSTSSSSGTRRYVPSPEAYRHYMKGHQHLRHVTEGTTLAAVGEFEAAVNLEPDYGQAWAALGTAYHSLTDAGWHDEPIWYEKAAEALARAIVLEPDDGQVRWLAAAQHIVRGRKREAYAELVAASQRAPHFWATYYYLAYLFRLCDMLEEALLAWEHAAELEPNIPWPYWGMLRGLLILHRHDEAKLWSERLRQHTGRGERESPWLALAVEGRFKETLEQFESGHLALGSERSSMFFLALAQRIAGDPEMAATHMATCESMASIDMDYASYGAIYYAHAGDMDRSFRYLDRAAELGLDTLRLYENPHLFGPLHGRPRWKAFIAGVRERVAAYRREFAWPLPSA